MYCWWKYIKIYHCGNFFLCQKLKSSVSIQLKPILDIFLRGFSLSSCPQHSLKVILHYSHLSFKVCTQLWIDFSYFHPDCPKSGLNVIELGRVYSHSKTIIMNLIQIMIFIDTVAYRPVSKRWLCKQQPLLGNARYKHARNNKITVTQPVSRQRMGKQASTTIEWLLETVFSVRSVQSGYKEDNWGRTSYLRVESPAMKERVSCKSATLRKRLYVCCRYSETVISTLLKSVARVRLVKTEEIYRVLVISEVRRSAIEL
jgi:hypothetical protein